MGFPRKAVIFCAGAVIGTALTTTAVSANPDYSEPFIAAVHLKLDEAAAAFSPKEYAINRTIDAMKDRAVNWLMDKGDKHVGGPFKKGGGDEDTTRELVGDAIDPRAWAHPIKTFGRIVAKAPSHTATVAQDTPRAYCCDSSGKWVDAPTDATPAPRGVTPQAAPQTPQSSNEPPQSAPNPDRPLIVPPIPTDGQPSHSGDATRGADSHESESAHNEAQTAAPSGTGHTETGHSIWLRAGEKSFAAVPPQEGLKIGGERTNTPDANAPSGDVSGHAEPVAPAAPAPAIARPAPPAPPARSGGGGPSHDPAAGSHEIFHGHDIPDHSTPGGRDVSGVA